MKLIRDRSLSAQIVVAGIKPFRLAEGVFEVRWRDGRRRRRALLAPANPLHPTAAEVIGAIQSAYPDTPHRDVVIPDQAWQRPQRHA